MERKRKRGTAINSNHRALLLASHRIPKRCFSDLPCLCMTGVVLKCRLWIENEDFQSWGGAQDSISEMFPLPAGAGPETTLGVTGARHSAHLTPWAQRHVFSCSIYQPPFCLHVIYILPSSQPFDAVTSPCPSLVCLSFSVLLRAYTATNSF